MNFEGNFMKFGELKIPHINVMEFPQEQNDFHTKLFIQYMDILKKTDLGKHVLNLLSNDKRVQSLVGTNIIQAQSSMPFDIERLGCWYLWRANNIGTTQAELELNEYLDSDDLEVVNIVWILGIDVDIKIEILDNIEIIPISKMHDSAVKEKFLQNRFKHMPYKMPTPSAALVSTSINKKSDGLHSDAAVQNKLEDICLLLNLLSNTSCLTYFSYIEVSERTPIGPFGGYGGSGVVSDVIGDKTTKLIKEDFFEITELYNSFINLDKEDQRRFYIIINRISQAKRRHSLEDKILDLVIALEMMLLDDNNKSQLKLQFKLRGSLLISKSDIEKKDLFSILSKLYDYRSSVAHSGVLKEKDRMIINDNFQDYCDLTEKICKTLIISGKPEWDNLLLGIEL